MSSVHIKRGTEGPRHDPYSYDEITVERPDGRSVTIHLGLAEWAEASDGRILACVDGVHEAAALFEQYAGVTVRAAERAYHEKRDRRVRLHKCGQRHFQEVAGYPGEHFVMCAKCGDIVSSTFNRSEIE